MGGANVMEMWCREILWPTNADDISIKFDTVKICLRDFDWLKSLLTASPKYQQHMILSLVNVMIAI